MIDRPGLLTNKLKESDDIRFFYESTEMSDSVFKASPYTTMVEVNEKVLENNTVQLFYKDLPSQSVQNYLSAEIEKALEKEKLAVNHVDPETYQRIKTALKIQLFDIDKGGKRSYDQVKAGLGFGFGYLIFIFIFLYGVQVMRGVMEEKQNRMVEVLISSVKPFQLMMGKIIGHRDGGSHAVPAVGAVVRHPGQRSGFRSRRTRWPRRPSPRQPGQGSVTTNAAADDRHGAMRRPRPARMPSR